MPAAALMAKKVAGRRVGFYPLGILLTVFAACVGIVQVLVSDYQCGKSYSGWFCVENCTLITNTTCPYQYQRGFDEVWWFNIFWGVPGVLSMLGALWMMYTIACSRVERKSLHVQMLWCLAQPFVTAGWHTFASSAETRPDITSMSAPSSDTRRFVSPIASHSCRPNSLVGKPHVHED